MPDTPLADRDGGPYDLERRVMRLEEDGRLVTAAISTLETKVDRLETKVDRLETGFQRLELGFARLEAVLTATLPHLATRAELAATRADVQNLRVELKGDIAAGLADKPGKTYMWGILAVLLAAYACGLAGLAVLK